MLLNSIENAFLKIALFAYELNSGKSMPTSRWRRKSLSALYRGTIRGNRYDAVYHCDEDSNDSWAAYATVAELSELYLLCPISPADAALYTEFDLVHGPLTRPTALIDGQRSNRDLRFPVIPAGDEPTPASEASSPTSSIRPCSIRRSSRCCRMALAHRICAWTLPRTPMPRSIC
jgi:hypothetical protein